ncbi:type VII secretion target [Glycomyces sp. NPDC047369]
MGSGYTVEPEELREHARFLDSLKERFDAIMSASAYIEQDDEAYGLLCGWISGCLEERHQRQDEITSYLGENFTIAANALRAAAEEYEASDTDSQTAFAELRDRMGA